MVKYYAYAINALMTDPSYTLQFDLMGGISRGLMFQDAVSLVLLAILQIAFHSKHYEIDTAQAAFYMALCLVGPGHSLWMARIVDDGTEKPKPRKNGKVWRLWTYVGIVAFTMWWAGVRLYFATYGNLNVNRNDGGLQHKRYPGSAFSLSMITWGMLEWMPYFLFQYDSFWRGFWELMILFMHVGAFVARQLYFLDGFSEAERNELGIRTQWRNADGSLIEGGISAASTAVAPTPTSSSSVSSSVAKEPTTPRGKAPKATTPRAGDDATASATTVRQRRGSLVGRL